MSFARCCGLTVVALVMGQSAIAAPTPAPAGGESADAPAFDVASFERPALLQPNIAFWTRIFSEYSEFQSIVHFTDQPDKIYTVLDYRDDAARLGAAAARREQIKGEKAVKKELDRHLKRVHQFADTPENLTPVERKVHALLAASRDPNRYKNAVGRFRAQRGLKEATARALQLSGRYLPKMEGIFEAEGLPPLLTRLPLVESSFNVEAYSKVGAAGLWQFIPSSARIYMRLDEAVDERRDPWTSTQAAARHLKEDYATLGNWPLAVTAYNHGRAGLAEGLRDVKGQSLEDLLQRWDGKRFGFASRNFYAEFLAAVDVERNYRAHFGELARNGPIEFEVVQTQHYVPYEVLRRSASADDSLFRLLNPGYKPEVLDGRLHVPPQSTIRVPVGQAAPFKQAYVALGFDERFDQQRFYYVRYRIQRGDTLSTVARRYQVPLSSLRQANGIGHSSLLRVGQVLRIPPRSGGRTLKIASFAEAAGEAAPLTAAPAAYLTHYVTAGQTLHAIARQYRTTIAALRQMNGLDEAQLLRAGATLKVPTY